MPTLPKRLRILAAALIAASWPLHAAEGPARALKLVVPFAPGGQPDVVARALAEPLAKALGKPVIVENRPGAGGNVAAESVARAEPDGHTLLVGTNGPLAVSPALYPDLRYDPQRAFAPVILVGTSPNLIAVHPSLGAATHEAVVDRARAAPGALNFASVGKGSISQLSMELFASRAGIRLVHVPYNGGAPAVMALLAGDVQLLSLNPTAILPQLAAGKVRVVAQTSATRSPRIPDIPTVAESGYPGFEAQVWIAIVAPAKTPPGTVRKLNEVLGRIIRDPSMKASLWDPQWIDPAGGPPQEAAEAIARDREKWARVVKAAGIAPD